MTGVSFLVPVRNGAATLRETLDSIWAQGDGRPMEIIVVDDRSTDGSRTLVERLARTLPIVVVRGEGRGAAAALNLGLAEARHPILCQVDQDVVLGDGWLNCLTQALDDPHVAAAQGMYVCDARGGLFARVMGRDLEERCRTLSGDIDHVCTGNTAYRTDAVRRTGGFDEDLGYGYDNDMSYRLQLAGHRLVFCPEARSIHRWRDSLAGYIRQQYGFGYGRLDVVAKHPRRWLGDRVSPTSMMLHPVLFLAAALAMLGGLLTAGPAARFAMTAGLGLLALLIAERALVGARIAHRLGDATPLWFPVAHVIRDAAWACAMAVWTLRRIGGQPAQPAHSMRPRGGEWNAGLSRLATGGLQRAPGTRERTLALIPVFNEEKSLSTVVRELRAQHPEFQVLVVDDGSTDGTARAMRRLGVRRLHLPYRMGIGAAVRVGLRYAARNGFTVVVRLDGDGQHRAEDIPRLLAPLRERRADVVLGSRRPAGAGSTGVGRWLRRPLAFCLTTLTGRRVTDPTCGFCALGPGAIRLLAEHHPAGYPEAELRLLLSRTALTTIEVPVTPRSRMNGRTSLTPVRIAVAAARILLAMCVEPLRRTERELARD